MPFLVNHNPVNKPLVVGVINFFIKKNGLRRVIYQFQGTVAEARAHFDEVGPRGEFTLVIAGETEERERWDAARVREALDELLAQGVPRPAAARRIATASGWSRAEVYELGLKADQH